MLSAKAFGTSTLNVNNNSFPGSVITDRDFRETGPRKQNLRPKLFLIWAALNFPWYLWPVKMLNSGFSLVYSVFDGQRLGHGFLTVS